METPSNQRGTATAKKLTAVKLGTVAKIAKASLGDLQKAGLSVSVAKKVSAAAKAASGAKTTAKNVSEKATGAAKKAASKGWCNPLISKYEGAKSRFREIEDVATLAYGPADVR